MGILCYTKPEESSLGDLLSQKQRELVADVLNKAMLSIYISQISIES